jgi:hypothetical protein
MGHVTLVRELWDFLSQKKKFWLLPLALLLVILGLLIVMSAGSALAPFIYTMF